MTINDDLLEEVYPQRKNEAKKYDHGSVFVIGGSEIYSGSPAISALAAMRAGADIAQVAAPERAADIVAGFSPDLITYPLKGKSLSTDHLSRLLEITESIKSVSGGSVAVVIGGGVGRKEETKKLIREYVGEVDVPVIIDADGIYAFENEGEEILKENCLFTPHLYEFSILTGRDVFDKDLEERKEAVRQAAAEMGVTIALKGPQDIISDGSQVAINDFPVPELTAGGCGDTLAGLAGAVAARTGDLLKAGMAATHLNTKAGKLAADEKGDSLVSMDLIDKISKAIRD